MNAKKLFVPLALTAFLAGCDQSTQTATPPAETPKVPVQPAQPREEIASNYRYSLQADGPDICLRKAVEKLGKETKVTSVKAFFGKGKALNGLAAVVTPKGVLSTCRVEYQDPQDTKKLLNIDMDAFTGEFKAPVPVQITVTGNADSFKLDDYLIPLGKIDATPIKNFVDGKKSWLETYYSEYVLDALVLQEPGPFNDKPVLNVSVSGLLASNGIKKNLNATLSIDGKRVIRDDIKPGK